MRICLAGSGGTGKTTLLTKLNEDLDYPVIQEGIREWLVNNNFDDFKDMEPSDVVKMQSEVMDGKIRQESKLKDFISDRTTLENLSYGLRWIGSTSNENDEWMETYINRAMDHAKDNYDIVFICPWGIFDIEPDGTRSSKKYYQYMMQAIIEYHLYGLWTSGKSNIHIHKLESVSLAERVAECMLVMNEWDLKKQGGIKDV